MKLLVRSLLKVLHRVAQVGLLLVIDLNNVLTFIRSNRQRAVLRLFELIPIFRLESESVFIDLTSVQRMDGIGFGIVYFAVVVMLNPITEQLFFYNPWVRKWGLLLPPPDNSFHRRGRSPSLEEGGLGIGKARVSGTSAGARCANSFHRCGGPPHSRREVFGGGKSKVGRMSAGNCNCEMCLQRWVASLQRSDVFATVGCTAVPRRGAHRAPVYPRCYNNPSSGCAKGYRGDRKAPISNRRQGRRP